MRFPPPLSPGARVGLIAPAGPCRDPRDVDRAIENTRSLGWEPVVGAHVRECDGYLAGSDAHRMADLNRFAADDSVDAVWCIRGGYGTMRLLDGLDYAAWRRRPKALLGYSDITALHAAVGGRAELVTFHAPTARTELTPFSRDSLLDAVAGGGAHVVGGGATKTLVGGRARGRLVGGNLALIASLTGTPYAPSYEGAIIVLEDVNESIYRIDRMLTQLRLAGALAGIAGIVFGQFTDIPDEPANAERPLARALAEAAERRGLPCVSNFPVGHIDDQATIPLGATGVLDADSRTLTIERS
ncbi:MAG: LD-carboxypeptidase [Gemmatimonadales bacterium]|jgi:muramoyltetrapeptide carboxypeptidase